MGTRLKCYWTSQLGPDAALGRGDCGLACAASLVRTLTDAECTVDELAGMTDLAPGFRAVHITEIARVLRRKGVHTVWAGRLTPDDVRRHLDARRALILLVDYVRLPARFDATYDAGHFILVHGYDDADTFYYDDPYWPDVARGEDLQMSGHTLTDASGPSRHYYTPHQALVLTGPLLPTTGEPIPTARITS